MVLFVENLWSMPHAFDPSYRDGSVCVCGLSQDDDVHARVVAVGAHRSTLAYLGAREPVGGGVRP